MLLTEGTISETNEGSSARISKQLSCLRCGEVMASPVDLQRHNNELCPAKDNSLYGALLAKPYLASQTHDIHDDGNKSDENESRMIKDDVNDMNSNHNDDRNKQYGSRSYPCEHCDKIFSDGSNLQRHIRAQHQGARSHTCMECGKTFATSSGLKQHQHIHSSVKPFQCEVCLKAYTQFSNLCRHKRMHADCRQQIKCKDCGQSFSTMTSLSKHKRFCEGMIRNSNRYGFPGVSPGMSPTMSSVSPHSQAAAAAAAAAAPSTGLVSEKVAAGAGAVGSGCTSNSAISRAAVAMAHMNSLNAAYMNMYAQMQAQSHSQRHFPFYPSPFSHHNLHLFHPTHHALSPMNSGLLTTDPKYLPRAINSTGPPSPREDRRRDSYANIMHHIEMKNSKSETVDNRSECTDFSSDVLSNNSDLDVSIGSDDELHAPPNKRVKNEKGPRNQESPLTITTENIDVEPRDRKSPIKRLPSVDKDEDKSIASPSSSGRHSNHEFPLDLSNKSNVMEEEQSTPRKNHIFGEFEEGNITNSTYEKKIEKDLIPEIKKELDITPEKKSLHFPYALPSPVIMDPIYRVNKEKYQSMQEAARSMGYGHRFSMGQSPFSPLNNTGSNSINYYHPHHQPHPLSRHHQHDSSHSKSLALLKHNESPYHHYSSVSQKMKERYCCKFCGKIFPRSANLTRHLRTHTGEQPYKCKYCDRQFSISSNLQRHVRNIHNKEKPYKCPLCDRSFGQQTNLDRHLKKHETDGPIIADSPPSTPASGIQPELDEKEESYFDEIRNFIDKTSADAMSPMSNLYEHHQQINNQYSINPRRDADHQRSQENENIDVGDDLEDAVEHVGKASILNHNNNHLTPEEHHSSDFRSDSEIDMGDEDVDIDDQYSLSNSSINSINSAPLACS